MTLIAISLAALLSRWPSIGVLGSNYRPSEIPRSDRLIEPKPVVVIIAVLRPPPPEPDSDPSHVELVGVDNQGRPLDGAHRYVVHFAKDALPPPDTRWSLTALENDPFGGGAGGMLGRGDPLHYNADRSLDVYLQREPPSRGRRANWLRSPAGRFNLVAHLRCPVGGGTHTEWTVPGVKRSD
jgi:Protein of unknown function (DUF1214)